MLSRIPEDITPPLAFTFSPSLLTTHSWHPHQLTGPPDPSSACAGTCPCGVATSTWRRRLARLCPLRSRCRRWGSSSSRAKVGRAPLLPFPFLCA